MSLVGEPPPQGDDRGRTSTDPEEGTDDVEVRRGQVGHDQTADDSRGDDDEEEQEPVHLDLLLVDQHADDDESRDEHQTTEPEGGIPVDRITGDLAVDEFVGVDDVEELALALALLIEQDARTLLGGLELVARLFGDGGDIGQLVRPDDTIQVPHATDEDRDDEHRSQAEQVPSNTQQVALHFPILPGEACTRHGAKDSSLTTSANPGWGAAANA